MEPLWFVLVAFMITVYVMLDGFDLGAGALHLLIGRTEDERRTVISTIGRLWNGNEVWLIAAGGTSSSPFLCSMPRPSAVSTCH